LVPPVARAIAARLPPSFDLDDLIATGNMALFIAARDYDPDTHGGAPFRAYARMKVRGEILESVRRRRYREATYHEMPADEVALPKVDNLIEMQIDGARMLRRLPRAMGLLHPEAREMVEQIYLGGRTPAEIDARLPFLKTEKRELLERALRELRQRIAA
jgi:RNA polymerase sigma factor (sigma-70 family)